DAVRNLGPLMGDEGEHEVNGNGGNGNGGNRNGNGNGGEYGYNFIGFMPARDALTWWNSHKRTIGNEAAYAMSWAELMKLMTKVYCTRNKIQKMETELMVLNEEDRVERFIGGLPDNIQGNGYAARSNESKKRMESNLRDNRRQ
ncbi:hypothetical protein Tco_1339508, partial [Tanacetum coccineum]